MSEKKTININPELFTFSKNTTKKKKQTNRGDKSRQPIKIKSELKNPKTLRRSVLKMIRENQEKSLKDIFSEKKSEPIRSTASDDFKKDFEESLDFFSKLAEKKENELKLAKPNIHNSTLRQYPNSQPNSVLMQPITPFPIDTNENVHIEFPEEFDLPVPIQEVHAYPILRPSVPILPQPSYGCLKQGSLPTYRSWKNQTQRVYPNIQPQPFYDNPYMKISPTNEYDEKLKALSFMKTKEKSATPVATKNNKLRYLKRKKIYKRTYHVGRSKIAPKIGVLISNRTLRNRTTEQTHMLKQIPIQEVRRYLIKKGFIKVGTTAPNDVLRKMYESVLLICGDVQNHNSENLLYNFINDQS